MKKIDKKEPDFYKNFIRNKKPITWFEVSKEVGENARKYMLEFEQNNQCAYTEKFIKSNNSHIDHFVKQNFIKQGAFKTSLFEWNNLLTSCNSEHYGAKFKDKNIAINDYDNLINPTKDNPDEYLEYTVTGRIIAKNNSKKGEATIARMNLNDYELVTQRKAVALQVKSIYTQFSVDEIVELIGSFESFIRAIYYEFTKSID